MVKTVGKYELYRTLGEGSFGKVKYAVNKETNEAVAIKILDKEKIQKQNMGAQIKKEISIMKLINHHNVVCVKDVFATTSKIFIVLELVEGGELFDKISSQGRLSEVQARFYFRQLAEGLDHCHSQGVCHRDLKPENLLLDAQGNIKISDFGLSALYVGDADAEGNARAELLHTTCGTPNYVAPEVLANHGYDGKRADVWSMGVILYVLLAGFLPFEENTMVALFLKIKNADFTYPSWFSIEVRQLLDCVLVSDPSKRLTLDELKKHQWLVEGQAYPDAPGAVGVSETESNNGKNATEAVEQSRKEAAAAHAKVAPISSTVVTGLQGNLSAAGAAIPAISAPAVTVPTVTAPVVTAPGITAPVISVPTMKAPVVTAPGITTPVVTAPVVTAPVVTAPGITAPVVTAPVISVPTLKAPVVTAPGITAPAVTAPIISVPTVTAPGITAPVVTAPVVTAPIISVPTLKAPVVTAPVITAPVVTVPVVTAPGVSVPVVTAPGVSVPVITAPTLKAPTVTLPAVDAPVVNTHVVTPAVVTSALNPVATASVPSSIAALPSIAPALSPSSSSSQSTNSVISSIPAVVSKELSIPVANSTGTSTLLSSSSIPAPSTLPNSSLVIPTPSSITIKEESVSPALPAPAAAAAAVIKSNGISNGKATTPSLVAATTIPTSSPPTISVPAAASTTASVNTATAGDKASKLNKEPEIKPQAQACCTIA